MATETRRRRARTAPGTEDARSPEKTTKSTRSALARETVHVYRPPEHALENPLRADGSTAEDYAVGKRVYYQNCLACHGDALDGRGHFAHGFNPAPLNFRDNGTIAQLTESFVFWRIAKGGPGLPKEATPWNSVMPAWEDRLTEETLAAPLPAADWPVPRQRPVTGQNAE